MALDKEDTSERVVAIARRLLEEGGAQNLKARTIAQEAGIAVGSIYNMFGDLNGLHLAVNMRLLSELGERGAAAMASLAQKQTADTRERLLGLALAYHAYVQEYPGAWAALLAYNRGRVHASETAPYVDRLDGLFQIIADVLSEGEPYLSKEDAGHVARTLWSSVHGIVTSGYAAHSGERKAEEIWRQVDLLVTTFLEGLRHRKGALTDMGRNA